MAKQLPKHAQVVIVGGGIVGCSVAYHLTKLNWKDVVLLERKALTSGTTWAAAGLVGQLWATSSLTKLATYGTELYTRLEQETGQHTGFVKCGSLRVAQTKERKSEYDRSMAMARAFGIEMAEISGITDAALNDLELVTIKSYPVIAEIKERLVERGAAFSLMSGSGPTVFGVFEAREKAEDASQYFKGFWTAVVQTIT